MKAGEMTNVRQYDEIDEESIVTFGLRAWAPVFASMREQVGASVFNAMYDDWRVEQDRAIRDVLADPSNTTWVWADESSVSGFVSAAVYGRPGPKMKGGEIVMLAVDPSRQRSGIGRHLTDTAIDWLRGQGVGFAAVETGGDPGHAAARAVYEQAGFTLLPIARYFQVL
jgi:GNAT superfamily N-acetyltransferase